MYQCQYKMSHQLFIHRSPFIRAKRRSLPVSTRKSDSTDYFWKDLLGMHYSDALSCNQEGPTGVTKKALSSRQFFRAFLVGTSEEWADLTSIPGHPPFSLSIREDMCSLSRCISRKTRPLSPSSHAMGIRMKQYRSISTFN